MPSREQVITRQPSRLKRWTVAWPMPRLAPVSTRVRRLPSTFGRGAPLVVSMLRVSLLIVAFGSFAEAALEYKLPRGCQKKKPRDRSWSAWLLLESSHRQELVYLPSTVLRFRRKTLRFSAAVRQVLLPSRAHPPHPAGCGPPRRPDTRIGRPSATRGNSTARQDRGQSKQGSDRRVHSLHWLRLHLHPTQARNRPCLGVLAPPETIEPHRSEERRVGNECRWRRSLEH